MSNEHISAINADFLTGSTETGLDRIRTRLLDLTNRNKLLNFRHSTTSSLRFVEVSIDSVFERLRENEKLAFLPVPDPPSRKGNDPPADEYAEIVGWNTSFDLENANDENENYLPVLKYQDQLDTISRKIAAAAKTAIEESGANMLYLVFGFLEWYESEDSEQGHLAPLIAVPVAIERSGGRGKAVETVIEYSGEDVEANLSLIEKMRRDFGLEMPEFEDDNPQSYFEKVQAVLVSKRGWRIRRNITLALLSFGKLLMFRDLDPKTWPQGHSIVDHPLVKELFEGSKNNEIVRAEEFDIDAPELATEIPSLIRDADSSQHSALLHALRGQSLVIEGPPGTGKSQTITNLIAASLASGKTILFVAEKLAALEVVRHRLDDAGLGTFCLEVHSHKTKKGALLADLDRRIQQNGTFRDPRNLDKHLSIVADRKKKLTRYAGLINKTVDPLKATIFEVLWARERHGQEIASQRDTLNQIRLRFATSCTSEQFTDTEQFLSIYAQHLTELLTAFESIEKHPWSWIDRLIDFNQEEQVTRDLVDFISTIGVADSCCGRLATAGMEFDRTLHGLAQATSTLAVLPNAEKPLIGHLLIPCRDAHNRALLSEFIAAVESYQSGVADLLLSVTSPVPLLSFQSGDKLSAALDKSFFSSLDDLSVAKIRNLLESATETESSIRKASAAYRELLDILGCETAPTLSNARCLLSTLSIIEALPIELLSFRRAFFEGNQANTTLQEAKQQAKSIRLAEASLGRDFNLSLVRSSMTPRQLKEDAATVGEASLLQRLFGTNYRRATEHYRLVAIDRTRASRKVMSRSLHALGEYELKSGEFENQSSYKQTFGDLFRGVKTPWDDLQLTCTWYSQVLQLLPEADPSTHLFRRLLFDERQERLKNIKTALVSSVELKESLKKGLSGVAEFRRAVPNQPPFDAAVSFEDFLARLQELNGKLSSFLQAVELAALRETVVLRNISDVLSTATRCRRASDELRASFEIQKLLKRSFEGPDTDIAPLKETLRFAELVTSSTLPSKTIEWLLCEDYENHLKEVRTDLGIAIDSGEKLRTMAERLFAISGSSVWMIKADEVLGNPQTVAQNSLDNREELSRWIHYIRLRIKSAEIGVERLTELAEDGSLGTEKLGAAYRYAFYNTLARSAFADNAELSEVTGLTQEQLRRQFAEADRESITLYSERVAAQIDRRPLPYGNQSGPVRSWTETALLMNEIGKQKRHIPIRQLILRSPNALLALKPCFMMGPLSVAQYLAPGQLKFDLVIMDEASQLKPEDAIGALARGGQAVIVGDPKQLPPTSFFQRVSIDEENETIDESRTAIEEGESILDVASTLFQPVRRLRWHYRSRHHSLIAFSNQEFYQGDLIIFPSAYHDSPALGVKYCFVSDGVFDNGRNPREAEVVVNAVLEHMRVHPEESLGVVTLNFEQRELVEELLDHRLRNDPAAIAFQERMKGGQESLFIKNLENVQGDERDVIFISTTYGQDARGNQFQRFGPINAANGHRRLNVLFTRSKSRTVIFSSLDPDRIQTTTSSPWGLRALKRYLTYARSGILEESDATLSQPTNDFERSVSTLLKERGFEVVPQVGVAGFFIDLAVKHPAKPGAFLLGIECDGASYHSGRSARDRDRLRQEILINLGWTIYRVWSTDWFKSRDAEIKKLLRAIEALLEKDPTFLEKRKLTVRDQSLRQQLEELRDGEIAKDFPETPADQNVLSDALLQQFLGMRPVTKEEWFRVIPHELRTKVDSRQVGKYLDKIFGIIALYGG